MKPIRKKKPIGRGWRHWIATAAMAPLAVGQSPEPSDSSTTRFGIGGGAGSYAVVARGCNGEVLSKYQRHFHDASVQVEHEFKGPLVLGMRAQNVWGRTRRGDEVDQVLWNPHAGLEGRMVGFGVGWVTPSGSQNNRQGPDDFDFPPVSGHLRVGSPRGFEISLRLMEGQPYFSSGGVFDMRASVQAGRVFRPWIGVGGVEPFDGAGLLVGTDVSLGRGLGVSVGGRLGGSEGIDENSVRAGLTYTWTHTRYEGRSAPPSGLSDTTTFVITLDGGSTVRAASIEPWSMGFIRVVQADGTESFIGEMKIRSIVSSDGADLTKRVLKERRRVP